MNIGKRIRLSNILDPEDGKCVMLAADHNFLVGPIRGLENVENTLKIAFKGKLDAVMLSPGQAKRLSHMFGWRGAPALVVRGDWANAFRERVYTLPTRRVQEIIIADPKDLISLGATGAVLYFFVGYGDEREEEYHYERIRRFIKESEKIGLPCLITAMPMGERVTGANFVSLLETSVRMAVEAGADYLEVPYTQDIETFKRVVQAARGTPVLCAGGPKAATIRDSLEVVVELLEAGASGVVFGRQVFQSEDPASYLNMLYSLVHEGKSIEEVLGLKRRRVRIKSDPEKCVGCMLCELICSFTHEKMFSRRGARLRVERAVNRLMPVTCILCGLCVKTCRYGALSIDPSFGYVKISKEKCIGCRECVEACPVNVIKFDEKEGLPLICDMCEGNPQCVEWCPHHSLIAEVY
ncbi:MAG: 4Fe-4S binding protein [Candidatus Bathyarchaeia archaeon]